MNIKIPLLIEKASAHGQMQVFRGDIFRLKVIDFLSNGLIKETPLMEVSFIIV